MNFCAKLFFAPVALTARSPALWLHLAVTWKRMLWIVRKLLHPIVQLCRMRSKSFDDAHTTRCTAADHADLSSVIGAR